MQHELLVLAVAVVVTERITVQEVLEDVHIKEDPVAEAEVEFLMQELRKTVGLEGQL